MPTNTITSPNMLLPVPVVGVDPGPYWANQLDNCLARIDIHDHSHGYGVQITPNGLNINSTLPFNSNLATSLLGTQFTSQTGTLTIPNALYVSGGNLFFNGPDNFPVQLTTTHSIVGASGNITNLVAPAAITYNPFTQTFVFTD